MSNRIPNDWAEKELGEVVCQIIDFRGRTPKKLDMDWGGGDIRALSANNVQMGKVDFSKECYFASDELYQKWMTKGDTAKDDIVFTMEAPLGNVALVPDNRKYILSQRVVLLKTNSSVVNNRFLFHQLRGESFQRQLRENATGSTALGIQQKRLVTLNTVLPPIEEQQKIASILTAVDEVIASTTAQINKLKDLKTGMMQELLTKGIGRGGQPHKEFKDSPAGRIPKAWDCITVGELLQNGAILAIQDGNHGEKHPKSSDFVNDGIPFVMASDIRDGRLSTESANKISEEVYSGLRIGFAKPGDVLLTHKATVGQTAIVPESVKRLMLTPQVTYYRIKEDGSLLNEFLYFFFQSQCFQDAISIFSAQSTRSYIGIKAQQELQVLLPDSVSEQLAIVSILKALDNKLLNADRRLNRIERLKKGLMQDLLTGKVRVIKSDDEQ